MCAQSLVATYLVELRRTLPHSRNNAKQVIFELHSLWAQLQGPLETLGGHFSGPVHGMSGVSSSQRVVGAKAVEE